MPRIESAVTLAVSVLMLQLLSVPQAAAEPRLPWLAQQCSVDVDGGKATAATLEEYLNSLEHHTLVSVTPQELSCAGYLWAGPIYLRAHATDFDVMRAITDGQEFSALHKRLFEKRDPERIIDLGANIGMASTYLAARYPGATVIGVEADLSNYRVAVLNSQPFFGRVHMLYGGAWGTQTDYLVIDPAASKKEWGNYVRELRPADAGTPLGRSVIPAYTVQAIMDHMDWDYVDYVKIDIECSEFALIRGDSSWLARTRHVTMEIHAQDWCGAEKNEILEAMTAAGFKHKGMHAELDLFTNTKPIASKVVVTSGTTASSASTALQQPSAAWHSGANTPPTNDHKSSLQSLANGTASGTYVARRGLPWVTAWVLLVFGCMLCGGMVLRRRADYSVCSTADLKHSEIKVWACPRLPSTFTN